MVSDEDAELIRSRRTQVRVGHPNKRETSLVKKHGVHTHTPQDNSSLVGRLYSVVAGIQARFVGQLLSDMYADLRITSFQRALDSRGDKGGAASVKTC